MGLGVGHMADACGVMAVPLESDDTMEKYLCPICSGPLHQTENNMQVAGVEQQFYSCLYCLKQEARMVMVMIGLVPEKQTT